MSWQMIFIAEHKAIGKPFKCNESRCSRDFSLKGLITRHKTKNMNFVILQYLHIYHTFLYYIAILTDYTQKHRETGLGLGLEQSLKPPPPPSKTRYSLSTDASRALFTFLYSSYYNAYKPLAPYIMLCHTQARICFIRATTKPPWCIHGCRKHIPPIRKHNDANT